MEQNPEYTYSSKTYTIHGTLQPKIYISKSFPQHSFDKKKKKKTKYQRFLQTLKRCCYCFQFTCKAPRCCAKGELHMADPAVSLYSEIELFISVYSWAGYENHISKRFALIGYAGAPRGVLRWGLDNAPTASNCKPKVKSAFPQICRNICFLATFLLVNQFAKIFMNSELQGHGYSQMLTYDNTTKYSPQMFSQYLACSRLNEKKTKKPYNNDWHSASWIPLENL